MREIKFRAWNKKERKFYYDLMIVPYTKDEFGKDEDDNLILGEVFLGDNTHSDFYPEIVELQQFTGLKDNNGKEIYEGDILAIENGRTPEAGVFKVMWEDCMFVLNWHIRNKQEKEPILNQKNVDGLDIIGNVFENPKLIK